jgi:hypothetical protein
MRGSKSAPRLSVEMQHAVHNIAGALASITPSVTCVLDPPSRTRDRPVEFSGKGLSGARINRCCWEWRYLTRSPASARASAMVDAHDPISSQSRKSPKGASECDHDGAFGKDACTCRVCLQTGDGHELR